MSDSSAWRRIGAWDGIATPGLKGAGGPGGTGIAATPRHDLAIACVIGNEAGQAALTRYFSDRFAIEMPSLPRAVTRGDLTLIWSGPSQWLAISRQIGMPSQLATGLAGLAAVTDQTDSRAVLMLKGALVRSALLKGCPVDLHPGVFAPGDTAITAIAGIGVQLWRAADGDAFHIALPRSMAGSFWSWLIGSAAEFGVEVRAPAEP